MGVLAAVKVWLLLVLLVLWVPRSLLGPLRLLLRLQSVQGLLLLVLLILLLLLLRLLLLLLLILLLILLLLMQRQLLRLLLGRNRTRSRSGRECSRCSRFRDWASDCGSDR